MRAPLGVGVFAFRDEPEADGDLRALEELAREGEDVVGAEGFVVLHELGIHLGELLEHIRTGHEELPLLGESANGMDAHFHGFGAAQHISGHEGSVLGEGIGAGFRELEAGEVVAICDHLLFFRLCELKKKILWKAVGIALHGGEEKRSAETGNWTFEGEDGAFAPETWVGSASQPSTLPLRVKTVATNFYSRGFA